MSHHHPQAPTSTGKTLATVQHKMNALGDTLRADVHSKKEYEENRLFEIKDLSNKVEKHLALEVKRRAESDKVLQTMFETKMKEMQETMEKNFNDKMAVMKHNVDILTKKIITLEKDLVTERERSAQLMQKVSYESQQSVQNIKNTLDQEKVQRMEKEAQLLRKSAEDVHRLQERLDDEKRAREVDVGSLRDAIRKLSSDKDKHDEKFRSLVLSDIDQLKAAVRCEHDSREQAEEQLAATMAQIVDQFEDAFRVVSK
eukprot:TRINITY_DN690_c0_g2_i1.p1 TRINITY_DN690_c0_g2~~TRINITY_DN690_c0_g2_i1.p1  ORF type:complete len:298 (+),score=163.96 TRINITY_DN690_c0_g2_i1:124-894(+)